MARGKTLRLSRDEARYVMLAAQGFLDPPRATVTADDVLALIDRLGVVQIDTISVVERSQYLVLWSRLGPYDAALLDELLYPRRATFEYWSHAASIVPMRDYPYYRPKMLNYAEHMWAGNLDWASRNPHVLAQTKETLRTRGPLASADFERPAQAAPTAAWDWYGAKESRRALEVLWTTGDLMVYRRRGGQKVYDLRERVLREAFGRSAWRVLRDDQMPDPMERLRYFTRRTATALGVLTPAWLWDYFRLRALEPARKRAAARELLDELVARRVLLPAEVEGLDEPAYIMRERLPDLERYRLGEGHVGTSLLSPFDSVIWDRTRARALFDYEVCFEAYVVPEKRRYGYYCLAILHQGRLVGRLDAKMERAAGRLLVRAIYLEPGIEPDDTLADGLTDALRSLSRFLGGSAVTVERSEPAALAAMLYERLDEWPVAAAAR